MLHGETKTGVAEGNPPPPKLSYMPTLPAPASTGGQRQPPRFLFFCRGECSVTHFPSLAVFEIVGS